jgi:hypothetical protein
MDLRLISSLYKAEIKAEINIAQMINNNISVGDPDLDLHVCGPPGSGSICQRYGSGSGSFPFLLKVLSGLK